MTWIKENIWILLVDYINLIFVLRLMIICYKMQDFNYLLITVLYVITIAVFWGYHELLSTKKHKYFILLTSLVVGGIWAYFNNNQILYFFNNSIVSNFNSINDSIYNSRITHFYQFKPFIFIFVPIITLLVISLNERGINNSILVITMGIMVFFWYLEFIEEIKTKLVSFIILSIMTYSINVFYKNIKQLSKQGIQVLLERNRIIAYIIVYSFIIAWIGVFLPQQYEGKYTRISEGGWRNPFGPEAGNSPVKVKQRKYGLSSVGYNNTEKKLGGPIELSDELAFKVNADKSYYLRGDVRELYTGSSWKKENEEYEKKSNISDLDVNRYIAGLLGFRDTVRKTMIIYPKDMNTSTIFVPNFVQEITAEKGLIYYEKNDFTFLSSEKNIKEFNVAFFEPNDVINAVRRRISYREIPLSRTNYEKYFQVPQGITLRTVELVYGLVKDCRSNMEKVEKIRDYLSKTYPYSLKVSEVPENVDFIDYFLFTEKKGYCVYFASAMTIMSRIAGVPARYVEGFKMPNTAVDGVYDITSEQAHAWTEVLVRQNPDIWMTVDCSTTPAEERQRLQEEQRVEIGLEEPVPEENSITSNEEQSDLDGNNPIENGEGLVNSRKIIFIVGIASLIILFVGIRVCLFTFRKNKMLKSNSVIPIYNYILKRIKLVGIKKSAYVTDMEFASDIYDYDLKTRITELVTKVYEEFYGEVMSNDYDKSELYFFIEKYIRERQNPVKYYIAKFFFRFKN